MNTLENVTTPVTGGGGQLSCLAQNNLTIHQNIGNMANKRGEFMKIIKGFTHILGGIIQHSICANTRKNAFTLAEVLITIGIIGIVAALTMPSLIQKNKEKATVTAVKKAYSVLSNAYTLAKLDNGDPTNWNTITYASFDGAVNGLKVLSKYMKSVKICDNEADINKCAPYKEITLLDGQPIAVDGSYLFLSDGSILSYFVESENCTGNWGNTKELKSVCAELHVDINGKKGPNIAGEDIFHFYLTKYGIVPFGVPEATRLFEGHCNKKINYFPNGWGCAAWVIHNENMDYLKCDDLSWDGKTKCK